MSRLQLALNVDNVTEAVEFYQTLFDAAPAKIRPGYANFALTDPPLKLVLIESPGAGGGINHLGVEHESTQQVGAELSRLTQADLVGEVELDTTCCYAKQDKFWLNQAPDGSQWEVYAVLEDSPTFFGDGSDGCCGEDSQCCSTDSASAGGSAIETSPISV